MEQHPGDPRYDVSTVAELYRAAFRAFADREALVGADGERMRYDELASQCYRMVRYFQAIGLQRQDGIVLLSSNRPAAVATIVAAHLYGLVYTPLHPLGSEEDQAFVLRDAHAKAFVVDSERHAERGAALAAQGIVPHVLTLGPAAYGTDLLAGASTLDGTETALDVAASDIVRIVYSGGTTGRSKGIVMRHRTVITTLLQQLSTWEWPQQIRYLAATPISHAAGSMVLTTFMRGGTVFLLDKYTPDGLLSLVEREAINVTFMVPTQIYGLLDLPDLNRQALRSLELVLYGAAPMAPARLAQALERIGPIFGQVYGQSEAPMTVSYLRKDEHDLRRPQLFASCGRVVLGNQVRLLDAHGHEVATGEVGEVCVRGPLVMAGYHERPEETAQVFEGGWLHTGDMGRMDAEGYLYLVDRAKDMIISGGFNVYSTEVEACLAQHPAVATAAVVGVPHEKWGEAVMALVVLKPGEQVEAEALIRFVSAHKGAVMAPKAIDFVSSLPLTGLGKIDKKAIRARYWRDGARQIG